MTVKGMEPGFHIVAAVVYILWLAYTCCRDRLPGLSLSPQMLQQCYGTIWKSVFKEEKRRGVGVRERMNELNQGEEMG